MSYETRYRTLVKGAAAKARKWRADHFGPKEAEAQMPLRSELFTVSQMEQHGRALAISHVLSNAPGRERLLDRLEENRKVLSDASGLLTEAVRDKRQIAPAGEWLLDNFYLIEEQIRTAKRHLQVAPLV